MADSPFVAEIMMFGGNFAPRGWAKCEGQLLPISQNTALFSLLGTTYGGNGQSTFALPNLQGSAAMHWGQGPGLSLIDLGQQSGTQTVSLIVSEIPNHTHVINAKTPGVGAVANPTGKNWSNPGGRPAPNFSATAVGSGQAMSPLALSIAGGSQPHNNLMPYQVVTFCIAMQGVFPARP